MNHTIKRYALIRLEQILQGAINHNLSILFKKDCLASTGTTFRSDTSKKIFSKFSQLLNDMAKNEKMSCTPHFSPPSSVRQLSTTRPHSSIKLNDISFNKKAIINSPEQSQYGEEILLSKKLIISNIDAKSMPAHYKLKNSPKAVEPKYFGNMRDLKSRSMQIFDVKFHQLWGDDFEKKVTSSKKLVKTLKKQNHYQNPPVHLNEQKIPWNHQPQTTQISSRWKNNYLFAVPILFILYFNFY